MNIQKMSIIIGICIIVGLTFALINKYSEKNKVPQNIHVFLHQDDYKDGYENS